jgi:hypothetical protein
MGIWHWHMAHGTWPPGTWRHGDMGKSKTRQRASQRNWRNQLVYVFNCCFRAKNPSKRVDQFSAVHIPSASSHRGAASTLYDQYMPSVVPPRGRDQIALRRIAAPPEWPPPPGRGARRGVTVSPDR